MIKLICKNLWARRRRNGWLLAELILVSVVSWIILDPVVVVTHDRHLPLGYDADRLCIVSLSALQPQASGYDPQAQDSSVLVDDYMQFVRHIQDYPGVEKAAPLFGMCYPNAPGNSSHDMYAEGDTLKVMVLTMNFLPHTRFFETYGFSPGKGRTPEQLSDYDYQKNDIVLTENGLETFFHDKDPGNKQCWYRESKDTIRQRIIGTIGTFKAYSDWRPVTVVFEPIHTINTADIPEYAQVLVRLEEGVSMKRFLHDFRSWMVKELRFGNLFARSVQSYEEAIADMEYSDAAAIYRRNLAMAAFFLINLCLGVIGTFWLQTRTRREEVGVILSFGGTPGYIVRMLMGEGTLLTFVAVFIGCLIYLQYAIKDGLILGNTWIDSTETYWVTNFPQHFLIVSFIVFLIMLAVVLIGIYIPARKISRIPPTEALRDE